MCSSEGGMRIKRETVVRSVQVVICGQTERVMNLGANCAIGVGDGWAPISRGLYSIAQARNCYGPHIVFFLRGKLISAGIEYRVGTLARKDTVRYGTQMV